MHKIFTDSKVQPISVLSNKVNLSGFKHLTTPLLDDLNFLSFTVSLAYNYLLIYHAPVLLHLLNKYTKAEGN